LITNPDAVTGITETPGHDPTTSDPARHQVSPGGRRCEQVGVRAAAARARGGLTWRSSPCSVRAYIASRRYTRCWYRSAHTTGAGSAVPFTHPIDTSLGHDTADRHGRVAAGLQERTPAAEL